MNTKRNGFTLVELIIVVSLVGLMAGLALPFFLSYLRAAEVQAGGREVSAFLAQARSVALKCNQVVTVSRSGASFIVSPTDPIGCPPPVPLKVQGNVTIQGGSVVTFFPLGNASPATIFQVQGSSASINVSLTSTGRAFLSQ